MLSNAELKSNVPAKTEPKFQRERGAIVRLERRANLGLLSLRVGHYESNK